MKIIKGTLGADIYRRNVKIASTGDCVSVDLEGNGTNSEGDTISLTPSEIQTILYTAKNPAAVALGKLGGSVKSDAKTDAARENGKKGGWPKGKPRKVKDQAPAV